MKIGLREDLKPRRRSSKREMISLQERARPAGGKRNVKTALGQGTGVTATLRVEHNA